MSNSGKVQGVDKLVMNGLFIGLLIWVSFFFSNSGGDPGFAIRHIGIATFCLIYSLYFFVGKHQHGPKLGTISRFSILSFGGFILIGMVSSFFAINTSAALLPIVTSICFLLLIAIFIHSFQSGLVFIFFAGLMTSIGGLMAILGILQFYEFLPAGLQTASPPSLLQFNRNFFGSSQVLFLPFALSCAYLLKGAKRVLSIGSIGLIIWSISISQTRSAVMSMLVFGFLLILLVALRSWRNITDNRHKFVFVGLAFLFIGFSAVIGNNYFGGITKNIKVFFDHDSTNRAQSSIEERLTIWKESIDIIKKNPIIGDGPGNWQIHIADAENQPHRVKSGRVSSNRAHNVYLEVLSESGAIGLLFYLSFVILSLILLLKYFFKESNGILVVFMGGGFIGFLSDQFFSFPNLQPTHIVMVAFFLGYIYYQEPSVSLNKVTKPALKLFQIALPLLSSIALYLYITFFFFEKNMASAEKHQALGDVNTALYYLNNASQSVHSIDRSGDPPELRKAMIYNQINKPEMSLEALHIAWKKHPTNPRIFATYGDAYSRQGDTKNASIYYQKAFAVQSRNFVLGRNLAIAYFELQEFQKCLDTLTKLGKTAVQNDPKLISMYRLSQLKTGKPLK